MLGMRETQVTPNWAVLVKTGERPLWVCCVCCVPLEPPAGAEPQGSLLQRAFEVSRQLIMTVPADLQAWRHP